MLGFALHPVYAAIARALPETNVSGIGTLTKIAVYYHRRLLATEDLGELRRDFISWMRGEFTNSKATEFRAPWEYWDAVALENPNSLLPKLAMRVLSIAVNTATCERLFSELGLIHTAKRNRMGATKALDFHIIAKHVRQRSQKKATVSENPKKKLMIYPTERKIDLAVANAHNLFTPSPQQGGGADEESDDEDPGDGVDGDPTFSLWGEFLDEVFEDEEIDAGYAETAVHTDGGAARESRESPVNNSSSELEAIPEAIKQAFTSHNDRNFPQEAIKLRGFRGRKATLEELFGLHVNQSS
ncbi:hypothetical protein DVH05_016549 [Phytophthora capsici]|nr:hypothetical protein DVH05_016549 [Phytophthora capsici]